MKAGIYLTSLASLFFLLNSCCNPDFCPAGSTEWLPWDDFKTGDSIVYFSPTDDSIFYVLTDKYVSPAGEQGCKSYNGSCDCLPCESNAELIFTNPDVAPGDIFKVYRWRSSSSSMSNDPQSTLLISCGLGGIYNNIFPFQSGNNNYREIIDTTINGVEYDKLWETFSLSTTPNNEVYRSFFHLDKGIVYFETKVPFQVYHLKP